MKKTTYGNAVYSDGTSKWSRRYTDKEAFSRWANKQFRVDEGVTVYEYEFDGDDLKLVCTWHA